LASVVICEATLVCVYVTDTVAPTIADLLGSTPPRNTAVNASKNSGGPEQAEPESNASKLAEETHASASEELATRTPVEAYFCPAKYDEIQDFV